MKALYRKYRPTSLDTVVAQDQVVGPLREALKSQKISHAYLFCGPRGTGKTSVARIFAHEINNFSYELEDSYIDIIEIDAASNTGVDNIRDLREMALIAPTEGKYKIYIIDEVHMLSKSAFNALLKLMEEPPAHVVFIMATTNPEKVPITITSRAQTFTFCLADPDTMLTHLKTISQAEQISITDDALKIIIARGGGSFRDTISLLDQISNLGSDITADMVDSALGLPASQKISTLLENYTSGHVTESINILRELLNSGITAENLTSSLIEAIVAHPSSTLLALAERLFTVCAPFAEAKLTVAFYGPSSSSTKTSITTNTSPISQPSTQTTPSAKPPIPASTSPSPSAISISDFLQLLSTKSSALASIVEKGKALATSTSIEIYPSSRGFHKILTADNNLKLLKSVTETFSPSLLLNIHQPGETPPQNSTKTSSDSSPSSNFSDIMGIEVQPLTDSNSPF